MRKHHVLIVGAGFAGLEAAKGLSKDKNINVTLVDKKNHHLFQPLLFQVAMAGLSATDISLPIRSLFRRKNNVNVVMGTLEDVQFQEKTAKVDGQDYSYDTLILACGARHSYFGNEEWEKHAPGLKTLSQALEIRRRLLLAYEKAEKTEDPKEREKQLSFVIVGGGPTGVELAGAIAEISRFTLKNDFRKVDPTRARVILIEAGDRILPHFHENLGRCGVQCLSRLGVELRTKSKVTDIRKDEVRLENDSISAATILWCAGVQAAKIYQKLNVIHGKQGCVLVDPFLSVKGCKDVFSLGDGSQIEGEKPLPGLAPVAIQQGRYIAKMIRRRLHNKSVEKFRYIDRGQMATIGRKCAVFEYGRFRSCGFAAWLLWVVVHIYFLINYKNRILVLLKWTWMYFSYSGGSRIIIDRNWKEKKSEL